jgi:hypothetical protein
MTIRAFAGLSLIVLAAVPGVAQVHCSSVPQNQKHSLALTLLLVRNDLRSIFTTTSDQADAKVQATPLKDVCPEVWASFQAGYQTYYSSSSAKAQFDAGFSEIRKAVGLLSPDSAKYGGGGQCPKGPELADLLK